MTIKTIFLDLDDVLCSFTMSALQYVGCPVGVFDYDKYPVKCDFDIVKAANQLHLEKQFTSEEFWNLLNQDFWANIPKTTECDWLLEICSRLVGEENVCILTAPRPEAGCIPGKLQWIKTELSAHHRSRQVLFGACKHFCARPDALLIDDSDRNVNAFIRHGGPALLLPRPWNSNHNLDTMKALERVFHVLIRKGLFSGARK